MNTKKYLILTSMFELLKQNKIANLPHGEDGIIVIAPMRKVKKDIKMEHEIEMPIKDITEAIKELSPCGEYKSYTMGGIVYNGLKLSDKLIAEKERELVIFKAKECN